MSKELVLRQYEGFYQASKNVPEATQINAAQSACSRQCGAKAGNDGS